MWRRKSSTSKTKSEAYLIYSEWGPDRQIPRDERLAACLPQTDEATRLTWMGEFDEVERQIWAYAEAGVARLQGRVEFQRRMAATFPFLNDDALGRTWSLAVYYTVHEGY